MVKQVLSPRSILAADLDGKLSSECGRLAVVAVVRPSSGPVRFGTFEVDPSAGELRKQGVRIKLQDQPLQILQVLLERPGEVVTREELRQRVWPADTFVDFDHGLYNAVKRLREALGDTAETPRYIETIPRRGYRFIGPVSANANGATPNREAPGKAESEEQPAASRPGLHIGIGIGLAAAVVLIVLFGATPANLWRRLSGKDNVPQIRSIAVLPLQNLSNDSTQEYFADAMTEELITELSRISALRVISRTSVMRYKKTDKSMPEIARELNVDGIIEGSIVRSGDRVRVTAQLIHAAKDTNMWAETYDRDLRDVLALQSEIARGIATEIKVKTTPQEQARLNTRQSVSLKALEAYLQGKYHMNRYGKGSGDMEAKTAISYFQQAIAEDPDFAEAYVEIGGAYEGLLSPQNQTMPLEKVAAEKALALDPNLAEAHFTMGRVKFFYDWDWPGAESEFRRAIELNPSSAEAHEWLGGYLNSMGRFAEGMAETESAQKLDPASNHMFSVFVQRGDEERGISFLRKYLEFNPDNGFAHLDLAGLYGRKGKQKEHIEELARAAALFGFPEVPGQLARAYARSGYRGALRTWAQALDYDSVNRPDMVAEAYAGLGDKDLTFQWLERAYRERDGGLVFLNVEPVWDPIRSDPRFSDLRRRVGLPQ